MGHIRERVNTLKTSIDAETLAKKSEECLKKLGFEFIKNGTTTLSEYEILNPPYFRIVIEPRKDFSAHNLIIPSISAKKGSTIDVRFDFDSETGAIEESRNNAKRFLRTLVESLPQEPWKGLGFRETRSEEKRWKDSF